MPLHGASVRAVISVTCSFCGAETLKYAGAANRAEKIGAPLYCNRTCSGMAKRKHKTAAQKVAEKALYDAEYRAKNRDMLKAKKHDYFKRTYDPEQAAIERKARMPKHVAYCRRPAYVEKKREYDRQLRAKKQYGEFAEAFLTLQDIETEISSRISRYEIYQQNGTLNKHLTRRRQYEGSFRL